MTARAAVSAPIPARAHGFVSRFSTPPNTTSKVVSAGAAVTDRAP